MYRILVFAAAALVAATLAACSPGVNLVGHHITFDASGLVVHAAGQPNAYVSRAGELRIDGKPVAVTPAQRQLLQRYYQQAHGLMDAGTAVGKQGVQMAKSGIDEAIASIFNKDSSTADKRMDAQSQKIEAAADALCSQVHALGATEESIAAGVPAFKPYVDSDHMQCRITHTVIVRHDDGTTTRTETSSFAVSTGSDNTEAKAAAMTGSHAAPASEAGNQP